MENGKVNFTKKQTARMASLEKEIGALKWTEYVDNDGTILMEGYCSILNRSWIIDRSGKICN